jgi:flagellar hook-associated protein 2
MGIVGISFGSPTSGAGFDVTSTVNQIVANLQNIESPWKTELASFQSQDTAISSLGTLLSTLSADVAQLTNFQGVLAEKQGSSSDTNVLALTGASSSAIAGTHTIVVNSLAATSSGYLNSITNASDTLSGSISIQVGSGTAHTITIDSTSNTLATLSAAINSAGLGVTASVLTDTDGSRLSLVSGTSGTSGELTIGSSITDSSTGTALAYNLATASANASLKVDGVQISAASNTVSTVIPGVTFQLLAPSPVTSGTPESIQVQILNNNAAVVTAVSQFVTDYNAVVGAINTQESNTTAGVAQPLFGNPTLTLLQEQLLSSINSTTASGYLTALPAAKASDTLSGSISIAVGSGASTTINLSSLSSGNQNLSGLASAINAASIGVTASVITDSTGARLSLVSGTSGSNGKLAVTSSIADGSSSLAYNPISDVNNLTQLGVSVSNDGTLVLDSSSLNSALNSDYSGVVGFFQNSHSFGTSFATTLNSLGASSVTGTLALALKSNSANEAALNASISNEDRLIATQRANLTQELNQANQILQSIPSNLNQVSEIYSAITGYQAPRF